MNIHDFQPKLHGQPLRGRLHTGAVYPQSFLFARLTLVNHREEDLRAISKG